MSNEALLLEALRVAWQDLHRLAREGTSLRAIEARDRVQAALEEAGQWATGSASATPKAGPPGDGQSR